jgi:putative nucleotidyltransferase with HDIG domain
MTAKMLQMVNTAFFGLPTKINNPIQAVNYLGINVIKSLVLCIQIFDRYENKPHLKPYINNLWYHSMLVASNCRELVRGKLKDKAAEEDVYVAGLLHDIGKIILLKSPGYFEDINKLVEKEKLSVFEAEKKLLGTGHDEVGAYLLRLWGLQEEIVNAVMNHHIYNFNNYEINAKSTVFIANKLTHLNINSTDLCKEKNKNFNDFSWYKE